MILSLFDKHSNQTLVSTRSWECVARSLGKSGADRPTSGRAGPFESQLQ
ncbi:MAG: hypothetical protein ACI861_001857 [Paracoccaceae bacterium]|jgi:hypothetical protein